MAFQSLFDNLQLNSESEDSNLDLDPDVDKYPYWNTNSSDYSNGPDEIEPFSSEDEDSEEESSQQAISKATLQVPIRPGETVESRARSVSPVLSASSKASSSSNTYISIGDRILALCFFEWGQFDLALEKSGYKNLKSIKTLREKATSRGWNNHSTPQPKHVDDAQRPGRPRISTFIEERIIECVCANSEQRQ